MASSAIGAKSPAVELGIAMAGGTIGGKPAELAIAMTALTGQASVSTRQRKGRLAVIEGHVFPAAGIVASLALRSKATIMVIILLVTGIAERWRALERTILMASLTFHVDVRTGQREGRFAVIERHILPAAGVMAGLTLRAKLAIVMIILAMAGKTIHRRAAIRTTGMTFFASDVDM